VQMDTTVDNVQKAEVRRSSKTVGIKRQAKIKEVLYS
jgi:hypothetical protein